MEEEEALWRRAYDEMQTDWLNLGGDASESEPLAGEQEHMNVEEVREDSCQLSDLNYKHREHHSGCCSSCSSSSSEDEDFLGLFFLLSKKPFCWYNSSYFFNSLGFVLHLL